jgi:hypothetical protein
MRVPAAQLRFLRPRGVESRRGASRSPVALGAVAAGRRPRPVWLVLVGCLLVSALTLVLPSTPTYDPWAWIMWGREIAELQLDTTGGPSWKPLPMLFTVPFSLFGDEAAPYLWLWIARAGGLLACAMAYRLAHRLAGGRAYGVLAGVAAALALFSSFRYVRDAALGNSEALLAGLVLWAFERHLDGRRDHAFYLGVAGALLRPEVWPFLGLYGLWLWLREPELRLRIAVLAALVPALWFLPELWGSGDPFRASSRASNPNPGSIAYAEHPALELAKRFWKVVIAPVKAGVVVAVGYAAVSWLRDRRQQATLALFLGGLAWFTLVAVMTERGYAGNQRYVIVSTAAASILGGVGAARVLQGIAAAGARLLGAPTRGARLAAASFVLALAGSAPFIKEKADNTGRVAGGLEHEAEVWRDLKGTIDQVGPERLIACKGIFSGALQTQMVAYELGVHGVRIGWLGTPPPGVVLRTRTTSSGPLVVKPSDDRYRQVLRHGRWRVLTVPPKGQRPGPLSCPAAGADAPRAPRPPAPNA